MARYNLTGEIFIGWKCLLLFLALTTSCIEKNKHGVGTTIIVAKVGSENKNRTANSYGITLKSFTQVPQDIEGTAQYFYLSNEDMKDGKLIYVDDLATISYVNINDRMQKFILNKHGLTDNFYSSYSGDYKLVIKIKKSENDENKELTDMQGEIVLLKKDDTLYKHNIIGVLFTE